VKLVSLFILFVFVGSVSATVVGWQNNGRGDFPDATPPTSFDGEKGIGVRWKAKLPNWSNSSPIVVEPADGKGAARVICLAEPLDYSPILLCFDADTGQELWRKELDAVAAMPKDVQDEARALAKRCWAKQRAKKAMNVEGWKMYERNKAAWDARAELRNRGGQGITAEARKNLPPELEPLVRRAKELDCDFTGIGRSHWSPDLFQFLRGSVTDNEFKRLNQLGLWWSAWEKDGTWDGIAFATPVSDGTFVWTLTAHNLYSCHDVDGRLIWQTRFAPPEANDVQEKDKERIGDTRKNGWLRGYHSEAFITAPLWVEGNLIANAGLYVRCLDAATGKLRWEVPMRGYNSQCVGVPGVVRVGGEYYILTVGSTGRSRDGDEILRLKDGAVAGLLPGSTASKGSIVNPMVIVDDRVVNITKEGLTGWKLTEKDGKIVPERLWATPVDARGLARACWSGGFIYSRDGIFDTKDGKKLQGGVRGNGYASDGGIVAGRVTVGWDFYKGKFYFTDIKTQNNLGEGALPTNAADGLPQQLKQEQEIGDTWRWLGAATPFAYKNCLYVRSYDFLWCLSTDTRDAATMVK